MKAILFVLATGIIASAIVELVEGWRRYQMRKGRRAVTRPALTASRRPPPP